jgi:hypothetical protein
MSKCVKISDVMKMMTARLAWLFVCLFSLALASCANDDDVAGTDSDIDIDTDTDTDTDTDIDTDTDSDTDTDTDADTDDECEDMTAEWGSSFAVGSHVSNYEMTGWYDRTMGTVLQSFEVTHAHFRRFLRKTKMFGSALFVFVLFL